MPALQVIQRLLGLGEQVLAPSLLLQRQRDEKLSDSLGEDFQDLVLRAGEIGKAVDDRQAHLIEGARLAVPQQLAGPPEAAFGIVQIVPREGLLVGLVQREQLGVLRRQAAPLASLAELLGPDLQPLELADPLRDQVDQAGRVGDRREVLQTAGGRGFIEQPPHQVPLHRRRDRPARAGPRPATRLRRTGRRSSRPE